MATLLLLGLTAASVAFHCCRAGSLRPQQPCRDTGELVTTTNFGPLPLEVSCIWSRSADGDGRKLLVRVDGVRLPPEEARNSSLILVVDGRVIDVPRNCVRCLEENFVVGEKVELSYRSVPTLELTADDTPSDDEAGFFRIRYQSFHPAECDIPLRAAHGFASASGLRLGQEVAYGCEPPYDAAGPDRAACAVKDPSESPVPEWAFGPPQCRVTNCSSTVHRVAGRGALASPGYPLYSLPGAVDCRWALRAADPEGRIGLTLTFLQLSSGAGAFGTLTVSDGGDGRQLASYGARTDKSLDLLTNSSRVVVSLVTNNSQPVKGGFYMEYRPLIKVCQEPVRPDFGDVLFTGLSVGSWASYSCLPGYALAGESRTLCQSDGTWTQAAPACLTDLVSRDLSDPDGLLPLSSPSADVPSATESSSATKATKPTRKPKGKAVEKARKAATKPKASDSPVSLEKIPAEEGGDAGSGDFPTDEQESEAKQPLAVNSAQDKNPKIKGNSTSAKQRQSPNFVQRSMDYGEELGEEEDLEEESKLLDVLEEEASEEEAVGLKTYVIIGVTCSLLLLVAALLVALVVYRKRFPVRMGFGRRFSTFENPIYASKDVHHSRELKRLTV